MLFKSLLSLSSRLCLVCSENIPCIHKIMHTSISTCVNTHTYTCAYTYMFTYVYIHSRKFCNTTALHRASESSSTDVSEPNVTLAFTWSGISLCTKLKPSHILTYTHIMLGFITVPWLGNNTHSSTNVIYWKI